MRFILAVVAVFVGVWATDFLIHGVWLQGLYKETAALWRPEAEMAKHMPWLLIGQFILAAGFVLIWGKGGSSVSSFGGSCLYGLTMGILSRAGAVISYAVQPIPGELAVKWFIAGLVQGVLMGALVYLVGRPSAKPAA